MKRNEIDSIVIHCSATRAGWDVRARDIERWHQERGYKQIGYHFVIDLDGTIEDGRPLTMYGAHCSTSGVSGRSYNKHSIGICYVGGLDANGRAADTRTVAQKKALAELVYRLMDEYPITDVLGHRDASPDANKDGKISRNEWIKECPCFDVRSEFAISMCVAEKKERKRKTRKEKTLTRI